MKYVWYRRTFDRPQTTKGKRLLLHIGACDWRTTAWLNGRQLGTHTGGNTPITFELTDALKPTKVKGQFSPGGQMPSITLKGVSIKGQSKVQYEEAAAAAQSDAQSALSQEKVPRAYQGAVKDYFDDLKNGKQ